MNHRDRATWPTIALLGKCLFGVGAPLSLPESSEAVDPSGCLRAVGGRQARPVGLCVATSDKGRRWLNSQTQKGYRPMLVGRDLVMLRDSLYAKRNSGAEQHRKSL